MTEDDYCDQKLFFFISTLKLLATKIKPLGLCERNFIFIYISSNLIDEKRRCSFKRRKWDERWLNQIVRLFRQKRIESHVRQMTDEKKTKQTKTGKWHCRINRPQSFTCLAHSLARSLSLSLALFCVGLVQYLNLS